MSNLKCPFCNKPVHPTLRQSDEYWCENYDCPRTNIEWVGSQKLWQELIRTRKALELAITGLKNCKTRDHIGAVCRTPEYVDKILEQITALEQKE